MWSNRMRSAQAALDCPVWFPYFPPVRQMTHIRIISGLAGNRPLAMWRRTCWLEHDVFRLNRPPLLRPTSGRQSARLSTGSGDESIREAERAGRVDAVGARDLDFPG